MHPLARLVSASFERRSSARRATAWLLGTLGPALLAIIGSPVRDKLGLAGFLFFTLLFVLAAAVVGGVRPALVSVVVGLALGAFFFAPPYGSISVAFRIDNAPLVIYTIVGAVLAILVDELAALVQEQAAMRQAEARLRRVEAALRRVATLVARAAPPDELFAAATEEVGQLLEVGQASLARLESDGTATILASWTSDGVALPVGGRRALSDTEIGAMVARTAAPARLDHADGVAGFDPARGDGARAGSSIAAPIVVQARLWGVMMASVAGGPLPAGAEDRLARFTELLATAISNAQGRDELAASRARIVAAADDTRRRIERDLHDGAQQRLVSLSLGLRTVQRGIPPELDTLRRGVSTVADGLVGVMDDLREFARGIHPAILEEGGIGPALNTLARRSPVPVLLDTRIDSRLPDRVEVAAYYVVSEALANIAKHAQATRVDIVTEAVDGRVHLSVRDDGVGGADPGRGTGLVGLRDRVEALGGSISVSSRVGAGTHIEVELPVAG